MVKQIQSNVIVSQINRILKKHRINYEYKASISHAFIGEPFYVNRNGVEITEKKPIWGYDINSAYKSALINKRFPLSSVLGDKETELGIFTVTLDKYTMRKKFPEFDYTLYQNLFEYKFLDGGKEFYMSNIDYKIFTTLWNSNIKIVDKRWFQDIGELPQELKDLCQEYYDLKQQVKIDPDMTEDEKTEWKTQDEVSFYGLHAKKLDKNIKHYKNIYNEEIHEINKNKVDSNNRKQSFVILNSEYDEWKTAYRWTNVAYGVRKKNVAFSMFQTAYLRELELEMFLKYKDSISYMNTDSLHSYKPLPLTISKKIGDWKLEYDGEDILYIRRNGYIIFHKDGSHTLNIGGIIDKQFTKEQLDELIKGNTIIAHSRNEDGKEVDIQVKSSFFNNNLI